MGVSPNDMCDLGLCVEVALFVRLAEKNYICDMDNF